MTAPTSIYSGVSPLEKLLWQPAEDDWRGRALCGRKVAEAYPEDRYFIANQWYPPSADSMESLDHPDAAQAAAICRRCPVRRECLESALEHDLKHGIFAGTTPKQRQRIKRRREKQRWKVSA